MKKISFFILFFFMTIQLTAEEAFLLMSMENLQVIAQQGSQTDITARVSPCSTFKVALSLMGFDSGILKDPLHPEWPYLAYSDSSSACNRAQTPKSWIANSCVWYSQQLTKQLGMEKLQLYVDKFNYGNRDLSGDKGKNNGLTRAWLNSSLKISMFEQVAFLKHMLEKSLPVSEYATQTTIELLFLKTLKNQWNLYAKTGQGRDPITKKQLLWLVGWVEKGDKRYIFAYKNEGYNLSPDTRIPRTEELLMKSGILD